MLKSSPPQRGQMAVVIIFIIAIIFIFFAVILNLGRVSQSKNVTTIAANVSAAVMASQMTSYAEMLYQIQLGGARADGADDDLTKCGWTGIAAILFSMIIMAVIYATGQVELTVFLISLGLSLTGLGLEQMVVQPGLTELWNKQLLQLDIADQFVERGVITALQSSVTDDGEMVDNIDMDMDGLYNQDRVSRFGYAYTNRLRSLQVRRVNSDVLKAFLKALEQFLYKENKAYTQPPVTNDNWGIWDPVLDSCDKDGDGYLDPDAHACCNFYVSGLSSDPSLPQECNPCCLPDGQGQEPNLRPPCCDNPDPNIYCGTASICPSGPFPYIYNLFYENNQNTFVSLKEFLGHDDLDKFRKTEPVGDYSVPQIPDPLAIYRKLDATGIYQTLWDISDHVQLWDNSDVIQLEKQDCFWCDNCQLNDNADPFPGGLVPCAQFCERSDANRLELTAACNGADCCAYFDKTSVNPSQIWFDSVANADKVVREIMSYDQNGNPVGTNLEYTFMNIFNWNAPGPGRCYGCQVTLPQCTDPNTGLGVDSLGWWKNGYDQSCSTAWPYYINCPGKHCPDSCGPAPCLSSGEDPCSGDDECYANSDDTEDNWPEDKVDEVAYGLEGFIQWAASLLNTDIGALSRTFPLWYPEAYFWITTDITDNSPSGEPLGLLNRWKGFMSQWLFTLNQWRDQNVLQQNPGTNTLCFPWDPADTKTIPDVIQCLRDNAALQTDENLRKKMEFRADFLERLYEKVDGVGDDDIVAGLTTAIERFDRFMKSEEVRNLQREFHRLRNTDELGLPSVAVYAWQSKPPKGRERGYWHIVRVDAASPGRCEGQCGRYGPGTEPRFAYMKTWTKGSFLNYVIGPIGGLFDSRRCWALGDSFDTFAYGQTNQWCNEKKEYDDLSPGGRPSCFSGGTTKARVIRYDEERDANLMTFANKIPIWRFVSYHPLRGSAGDLVGQMVDACGNPAAGAFILNSPNENTACWEAVARLLERGVMSHSCAEYYFHPPGSGMTGGFSLKFVKCDPDFVSSPLR